MGFNINIPVSITATVLILVFVFNISSLNTVHWFVASETVKDTGVTYTYDYSFGLTGIETCGSSSYGSACVSTSYDNFDTSGMSSKDKQKLAQTRAGGALAIVFLALNIVLVVALEFVIAVVSVPQFGEAIPQIAKNPLVNSTQRLIFFNLVAIPLQVIAIIFWAALFSYYHELTVDLTIGAGIILVIVSVVVPAIAFGVSFYLLKNNPQSKQEPTPTPS